MKDSFNSFVETATRVGVRQEAARMHMRRIDWLLRCCQRDGISTTYLAYVIPKEEWPEVRRQLGMPDGVTPELGKVQIFGVRVFID